MVATTWRDTSIRPRSLAWISVLGGFPVRWGLAFVFESIVCYYQNLISPQSYAMIREAPKQNQTMAQRCAICGKGHAARSALHLRNRDADRAGALWFCW